VGSVYKEPEVSDSTFFFLLENEFKLCEVNSTFRVGNCIKKEKNKMGWLNNFSTPNK